MKMKMPKKANGRAGARIPEACIARGPLEEMFAGLHARLDELTGLLRRVALAVDVDPDKEGLT